MNDRRWGRAAAWTAIALSGALVVFGMTNGAALPILDAAPPLGPYRGPYWPASRVVVPMGLKNASLTDPSIGYAAPKPPPTPTPTATPVPPTPTPVPTSPPRGPYGPPR